MRSFLALLVLFVVLLAPLAESQAVVRGASRANCFYGWNESRTWEANPMNVALWLWTNSYHYYLGTHKHTLVSYWAVATQQVIGHYDGVAGPWGVFGRHWYWRSDAGTVEIPSSWTTVC